MKYLISALVLAGLLTLSSCGNVNQSARKVSPESNTAQSTGVSTAGSPGMPGMRAPLKPSSEKVTAGDSSPESAPMLNYNIGAVSSYIIKIADLRIEVDNIDVSSRSVVLFVKQIGGFIESSNYNRAGSNTKPTATVVARVPSQSFERALENFGSIGKIKSKSISGEDVTYQIFDASARLRNKRAEEAQYVEIMQKAKRIPDIISVSNELFRVREEIERLQGAIKGLKTSADMSTITIEFTRASSTSDKHSIGSVFTSAWKSLARTSTALLGVVIWMLVYSPYWLGPIAIIWLIRRALTSRRQRQ